MRAKWFSVRDGFDLIANALRDPTALALKQRAQHFTRGGPLTPELLISLLVYLVADGGRRGYAHVLDAFWDEAKDHDLELPTQEPLSAAAFCKARRKLKPEAVRMFLRHAATAFDDAHGARHRFKGRRIFGVDGSKHSLQRSDALFEAFGAQEGAHCPQILVCTLFDVIAKVPHDARVAPCASSEAEQLRELLEHLEPGDVLVLDRGYPSYDLIETLLDRGIDFVIRVSTSHSFKAIDTFLASGGDDYRILLGAGVKERRRPLEVRAVRREGKDGEPQVFLTSLKRSAFTRGEILEIYRMRWEVELFFRLEKGAILGHHQFHAKSADGVVQEVLALHLYVALCRHMIASAAVLKNVPYDDISQKGAILATCAHLTRLLVTSDRRTSERSLLRLLDRIARRLEPKRYNRSFPRRSFKPRPRWGPNGRTPK